MLQTMEHKGGTFEIDIWTFDWEYGSKTKQTRSDILQGQALFRGVKQLRRCLVMLKIF